MLANTGKRASAAHCPFTTSGQCDADRELCQAKSHCLSSSEKATLPSPTIWVPCTRVCAARLSNLRSLCRANCVIRLLSGAGWKIYCKKPLCDLRSRGTDLTSRIWCLTRARLVRTVANPAGKSFRLHEPFALEQWQSEFEGQVKFNLADSGVSAVSLRELVPDDDALQRLLDTSLHYPEGQNLPCHWKTISWLQNASGRLRRADSQRRELRT